MDLSPIIVRSARRRRIAFTIRPEDGRLVVIVPIGASDAYINRAVANNQDRIDRLRQRFERTTSLRRNFSFDENSEFLLLGKPYKLHFTCRVLAFSDGFYVPYGDEETTKRHLETLYRRLSAEYFSRKCREIADSFDLKFAKIRIGGASGRWGSCSRNGNLNFSWRLILWPEEVVDYVIAHELAHLLELNHSARFWQQVERICPKYRTYDRFLRERILEFNAWQ
ncbi:MAG: M48 family metallopeptidase [Victivallales bacterium]|nr:M48 family metallopeptidase [Victivallales bacterium]